MNASSQNPTHSRHAPHGTACRTAAARLEEQYLRWLLLSLGYLVLALLLMWPGLVLGQDQTLSLQQIAGASAETDESRKLWRMLLGSFADAPLTAVGAPSSLMGGMFMVLNTCFFTVGVSYFVYGMLKGLSATGQEGEVLGKRQSIVWFPIRGIIGITGSMPVFGGFNLMQAVLVYIMLVGIGAANMVMGKALDMTNQFQGMLQPAAFAPSGVSAGARDVARQMFLSKVCTLAYNEAAAAVTAAGGSAPVVGSRTKSGNNAVRSWGTAQNESLCGSISVTMSDGGRSQSSAFAFRVASVNYEQFSALRTASFNGWVQAVQEMDSPIETLATNWYTARKAALDTHNGVVPQIDVAAIDAAGKAAIARAAQLGQMALQGEEGGQAISTTAMNNMRALGWIGIGAWYSTFAEANAAVADAANAVQMGSTPKSPSTGDFNETAVDTVNAAAAKLVENDVSRGANQNPAKTLLDSAIEDAGCSGTLDRFGGTATGNCSFGQGFVSAFIRGTTIGSGGGGNGEGALSFDSQGLVNPIIAMKNAGDYVLIFAQGMMLSGPIAGIIEKVAPHGRIAGAVGKIAEKATSTMGGKTGETILNILSVLAFALLVAGAAMSVYVPMIPFITWMGAVLAYAASMFEGLAGASLHAVSHLESEGDGLGQRTSHGYIFWVNALARPALMVIGFFAASALMIAIGTLQAHLFLPAMANVQGNSITGLASILLFILVFAMINISLITGSMNLIYVITDQVIGFIGGHINSHLGRDVEGRVNAAFLMAARMGPQVIGQTQEAMDKAGKRSAAAGASSRLQPQRQPQRDNR